MTAFLFDLVSKRIGTLYVAATPVLLSSKPYPVVTLEKMSVNHQISGARLLTWLPGEINVTHALVAGDLRALLSTYSRWPTEKLDISHSLAAGVLVLVLKTYSNWPPEKIDVAHDLTAGVLQLVLLTYSNWPVEKMDITHAFTAGVLT